MNESRHAVDRLYRERPRSRFLSVSGWFATALVLTSWLLGGFLRDPVWNSHRAANLRRFLDDIVPYPLQGRDWSWPQAASWAGDLWRDHLGQATATTLAISVVAILLAGLLAILLAPWAARNFARPEPFLPQPQPVGRVRRGLWTAVVVITRGFLILLRSLPGYVWAFLLLGLFGPTAWPLVLALALHNAGILGKLSADMIENLEGQSLSALRGLGAHRSQIAVAGIVPQSLNRFLLYLFYRWETCVRQATVLGMLSLVSLGFWIQDARARNHYDEMVLAMACGALLVVVGDLVSAVAREVVRRS